jgi:hypothetical protein
LQDYHVYVVDDGSLEEHCEAHRQLLSRYGARFTLLQPLRPGEAGSGPAASRNRGLFAGAEPFIAFLDDDDAWIFDAHLQTAVSALEDARADLFCADMQAFSGDKRVLDTWYVDRERLRAGPRLRDEPPVYRCERKQILAALGGRVIHPNMLVLRRSLLTRAGGFLQNLWFGEDTEFTLRLLDRADGVLFSPTVVARYRLPGSDSHSTSNRRTFQELNTLAGAYHLSMSARTPEIRKAARDIRAWTLRALSQEMSHDGRRGDAIRLAVQALVVRPSLGGLVQVARSVAGRSPRVE